MKILVRNVHITSIAGIEPGEIAWVDQAEQRKFPWALKARETISVLPPAPEPEPEPVPDRHAWKKAKKGK